MNNEVKWIGNYFCSPVASLLKVISICFVFHFVLKFRVISLLQQKEKEDMTRLVQCWEVLFKLTSTFYGDRWEACVWWGVKCWPESVKVIPWCIFMIVIAKYVGWIFKHLQCVHFSTHTVLKYNYSTMYFIYLLYSLGILNTKRERGRVWKLVSWLHVNNKTHRQNYVYNWVWHSCDC